MVTLLIEVKFGEKLGNVYIYIKVLMCRHGLLILRICLKEIKVKRGYCLKRKLECIKK